MGGRRQAVGRGFRWLMVVLTPLPGGLAGQATPDPPDPFGGGWAVELGLSRQGTSDELASPLRYVGTGLLVGVGYATPAPGAGLSVRGSYAGPRTSSQVENDAGGFQETHQAELGVGWLAPVGRVLGDRVRLHAGVGVDVRLSLRFHHYDAGDHGSRTENFGDAFVPLQAAGMWSLPLGSAGYLTHRVSVPLLTVVLRSPYTGLKYAPDPALAGPGRATGFESEVGYRRRLSDTRGLTLFHRMSLLDYPDPLPLTWIVHRLGVRLELGR